VEPVRSALLGVKGVTRARVDLDKHEALVVFDPLQATVDDLIKAVRNAKGPSEYDAKLKSK
jgi:copper chaperone CopZ